MTPPPAEELLPRLFLGPALRAQSDRRLVGLVRGGYEAAFDEIMRRYAGQLRRYAGAIVGGRAEDVTQEAFSKALQALRRDGAEIELRPWLYRIVRNTALNDIRDRHPATLALADGIVGQHGVAEEVERREDVAELIDRLRALPEPQRAAIVMRELEGLGHDEIASALGISGGAARQTIHRARTALRNGLGMAVPLPVLRAMLDGNASQSAEIAAGGAGAGIVVKAATATALIAGTFGASVALHETSLHAKSPPEPRHREHGLVQRPPRPGLGQTVASRGSGPKNKDFRSHGAADDKGGASARTGRARGVSVDHGNRGGPGSDRGPGPRSGGDGGGHQAGSGDQQPSGHDGGGSGDGGSPTSGEVGGSSSSGDGSGDGGGSSSGDGGGSGSTELSESTSNDGPDTGDSSPSLEGASSSNSGDSGDSSGGEVLSGQTQLQP
jgi:RNA polymerase sigma factor (sigma-70 family)